MWTLSHLKAPLAQNTPKKCRNKSIIKHVWPENNSAKLDSFNRVASDFILFNMHTGIQWVPIISWKGSDFIVMSLGSDSVQARDNISHSFPRCLKLVVLYLSLIAFHEPEQQAASNAAHSTEMITETRWTGQWVACWKSLIATLLFSCASSCTWSHIWEKPTPPQEPTVGRVALLTLPFESK